MPGAIASRQVILAFDDDQSRIAMFPDALGFSFCNESQDASLLKQSCYKVAVCQYFC